jgi:hypothetical protein
MANKQTKKTTKSTKTTKKCECKDCKCGCAEKSVFHSQASFYVLIGMLVMTMTVLVISLSLNKSIREIFRPASYVYNGRFDNESTGDKKDENDFVILSAGAVADMFNTGKTGFLIISDEKSVDSDAFARRVANFADDVNVYRYNIAVDKTNDDECALGYIGEENTPSFIYIKDGIIFDRLDDVKDESDLESFIQKYTTAE